MTALVIVNSHLPSDAILAEGRKKCGIILCADGGANRARERGLAPDYVVGDLDSVTNETRRALPKTRLIHRPSQYISDLEKTLEFAGELRVRQVLVVGVSGLRLDHQIVNLNLLEKFCHRLAIETHDDYGIGTFIAAERAPATVTLPTYPGQQVSLIAFRRAEGISTQGLKYPLDSEALEWAVRDGLSNEATANSVSITVRSGNLFCYRVRRVPGVP